MPSDPAKILIASQTDTAAGHRARLRERFEKSGLSAFAEHEVVELLLTLCLPRHDVKPQAKSLLQKFGSLKGVLEAPIEELREVKGIGEVAPVALRIIKAAAELYLLESAGSTDVLNNYAKLEAFWRARFSGLKYEAVEVAYLDKGYRLLRNGVERLSEGNIDAAQINQQQLFKKALSAGTRYLVLAHNHPTGDIEPSAEDKELTEHLVAAARAVEIDLLDHWIVGKGGCFSFKRAGYIL
jgi:DNA repair protein RadC